METGSREGELVAMGTETEKSAGTTSGTRAQGFHNKSSTQREFVRIYEILWTIVKLLFIFLSQVLCLIILRLHNMDETETATFWIRTKIFT